MSIARPMRSEPGRVAWSVGRRRRVGLVFDRLRPAARGQAGQTLPLICLFTMTLLGFVGMVIDVGSTYVQRQEIQNAADAAALAGASAIPSGTYQTAAQEMAAKNDVTGDQVAVSFNNTDSVTVTVTRSAPTYFLRMFDVNSISVSAAATAKIEAIGQIQGHVSPYVVTQQAYANGTGTTLFQESGPGSYGTVDLPTSDNTSGGSCSGNTNKGTPTNIGNELSDQLATGPLVVGGCLSVKGGASQPSANIVNQIPPANNSMSQDLQSLGNGQYQVIPQSWDDSNGLPPRLMYIPIVQSLPGGNGNATIVGFAWFYLTSATGGGSGLTITGQWVTVDLPASGQTTAYQPGVQGQVLAIELTQ
jgi:Flp pilus assembly protein TadG